MNDDDTTLDSIQRSSRIEARQFARVFKSPDGKAVLEALKRDFGWDAATPIPDKEGNVSASRLRAWTGARGVIATILHKVTLGKKLSDDPTQRNDTDEN